MLVEVEGGELVEEELLLDEELFKQEEQVIPLPLPLGVPLVTVSKRTKGRTNVPLIITCCWLLLS